MIPFVGGYFCVTPAAVLILYRMDEMTVQQTKTSMNAVGSGEIMRRCILTCLYRQLSPWCRGAVLLILRGNREMLKVRFA